MTYLRSDLKNTLSESSLFADVAKIEGVTFREVEDRRTFRFVAGGKAYFAKLHYGVGWREILKNLLQLRLPVLGAKNEWLAIQRLKHLGIATLTPAAYTSVGLNPATIHSCIVTEALDETISLEDLVLTNQLTDSLRRKLVIKVAGIARQMHAAGVNHRDFYICHFLLDTNSVASDELSDLHLIDLHRAQLRPGRTPDRWCVKDVAGLLFSAADAGLTQRDLCRFVAIYSGMSVKHSLDLERGFWLKVVRRAKNLYQRDHGKLSPLLSRLESSF